MYMILALSLIPFILLGCAQQSGHTQTKENVSAGLLVTDSGLGDDSFSDSAFQGLERARDELGITFDYREPSNGQYKKRMEELIQQEHDVIIGLGFNAQSTVEDLAAKYPEQDFVLIDAVSKLENVTSITFKEDEGSFLIGLLAGMKTTSDVVGYIGGEKIPVTERFESGFKEGVATANPEAEVLVTYANTFNDDQKGQSITRKMVNQGADNIFHAAGFTGIGALKEAQAQQIFAYGVDSDQFFVAEEAVVTSMLKNVNVALFNVMTQVAEGTPLNGQHLELGIEEDGVGLAPIRLITLTSQEQKMLDEAQNK
ncbi:BMP family ABC transporter substrate-binding protein [Halobacillus litoralis]|uniref:BMP family lipoprotein n=1 Tax=Halobacillus litoralis TaxID=45668 RepID=UPI001CD6E489|nr:BMP family ABC transporter substrate-binding protein [Halobacillus litoralis]MCA0972817.1 BMP family ABC transporter substrate-binding protein [Halobacillus litoralis]